MTIWVYPVALLIGLLLGLFGAGGGMLTVPALMAVADLSVKEAVPMSLWIVALVSLTAAVHQRVWKRLQWRLLTVLGLSGIIGSSLGAKLATLLSDAAQLGILSLLIFFVAAWTSLVRLEDKVRVFRYIPASVAGVVVGLLTGVLGVGGGFLLVPVLLFLGVGHFPTAVGHSLLLICLNAASGVASYLSIGDVAIDLGMTLAVAVVAAIGSLVGGTLLRRGSPAQLQKGFAVLLLLLGCLVGWQSVHA